MKNEKSTAQKTASAAGKSSLEKKPSMQSSQLMSLFEDELKDIYWAENALLKAIPKMIKKTTSEELNHALTSHLEETKEQITRLEKVFTLIKVKAEAKKCEAMEGLIKEASEILDSCEEGSMRDAGIISAAQKVEHYEIATYGTLRQFAETLQLTEVEKLLAMEAINVEASEEEAYSLASLIMEQLTELKKNLEVKIFASDIDKSALIYASKGIYPASISNEISAERLE